MQDVLNLSVDVLLKVSTDVVEFYFVVYDVLGSKQVL